MSNSGEKLAVKASKRSLMEKVGPSCELNNDKMVQALLTQRNTPGPGCKLSPAQILLGRNFTNSLPYVRKKVMTNNNPLISKMWRDVWSREKKSLSFRYLKSLEI